MLTLDRATYDEIRGHGEGTYPQECCGILLGARHGQDRRATRSVRCENARADAPWNRYQIDPREILRAERQARERGDEIVGFYHSHPDHPARWSQTDLGEAHWFGCSYVITAVEGGVARDTRSFLLAGGDEADKRLVDEEVSVDGIG